MSDDQILEEPEQKNQPNLGHWIQAMGELRRPSGF
jgi:hypothetical protein